MRSFVALAVAVLLVACAAPQTRSPGVTSVAAEIEAKKQRELALQAYVEMERRLYQVGYPLLAHGTSLCGERISPAIGMVVWSSARFGKEWREALGSRYGITDLVQVAYVSSGSPAERMGIRAGDTPLSLNGWPVPAGEEALEAFGKKFGEQTKGPGPIEFVMRRGDGNVQISVTPEPVCDFEVVLANKGTKNAYADGERIVVHRGLMEFFRTDQEVALVVAHELAHNTMGHIDARKQNAVVGGLLGLLVDIAAAAGGVNTQGQMTDLGMRTGAMAYSVEFEKEADYVGLYLMALAGYEIAGAADFWRRMAIQDPQSIQLRSTHPTTPERFIGIEKSVAEIQDKIARGLPLEPEIRKEERGEVPEPQSSGYGG